MSLVPVMIPGEIMRSKSSNEANKSCGRRGERTGGETITADAVLCNAPTEGGDTDGIVTGDVSAPAGCCNVDSTVDAGVDVDVDADADADAGVDVAVISDVIGTI